MDDRQTGIEAEAIGWVIRLRDAGTDEWEAFTRWLEVDPAHAAAYEEAALADEDFGALAPAAPQPAAVPARPSVFERRAARRAFVGGAMAAAIAGIIGYSVTRNSSAYMVETAAGEHRTVTLADGSRIALNGATRLQLDRDKPRYAALESGEALFTVVHDAARPFEVRAGDAVLVDRGTVFNVAQQTGGLEVGVAEGAVEFSRDGRTVDLRPGMSLRSEAGKAPLVARGDPHAIGGWTSGRLSYVSQPVARVAADLTRNLGTLVTAAGEVAAQPFSGVIQLDREPEQDVRRAAVVMGLGARKTSEGWILTGAGETP